MIARLVAYTVGSIVAVLILGTVFQDRLVTYTSETAVLTFGVVLGVLSAFIKPVVKLITFPLTCLTFGLFALVVNAMLFAAAAFLTPGMEVTLWGAVIGAICTSVIHSVIYSIVDER
jgi:putative membrane protein